MSPVRVGVSPRPFRRLRRAVQTSLLLGSVALPGVMFAQGDPLHDGFVTPPNSARPRVWWHWMNGNISREGIRLDIEWMNRVGIGGFHNFDASLATPQVVDHRLLYMTPEWKDAFSYAIDLAGKYGMEVAIAGSPGWSETGGPWVKPAQAMKKYVWSEMLVEGGKPFHGVLPHPPTATGPFQDMPHLGTKQHRPDVYYADSSVVAYRVPEQDVDLAALKPKVTASSAGDVALLTDGKFDHSFDLPMAAPGEAAWVQFEFAEPVKVRSVSLAMLAEGGSRDRGTKRTLLAGNGANSLNVVAEIPDSPVGTTLSFAPVKAKVFRVTFVAPAASDRVGPNERTFSNVHHIAELEVHSDARVRALEAKAGFTLVDDAQGLTTAPIAGAESIAKAEVIDVTDKMSPDGTLTWTPPAGEWRVLRFGYSLLGIANHPATAEATGLEVDKLDKEAVRSYIDTYLDTYKSFLGQRMGKQGLQYIVNDSWEAGPQNWTGNMLVEFAKRRGYDPHPWMPVLTGRIVSSAAESDRFLWDFRKTIEEMTAEYHYGQLQESIHARGLGHYGESHEVRRALLADGMEVKKMDDIPMSAMWVQKPGVNADLLGYDADDRESASVAHLYGQNLAAAESMTAHGTWWQWSPATLKPTADKELAEGINRFVIHSVVHQPLIDKKPGLTLGPFGQWFNRNETWAEQAKPWIDYLSRSAYLLQQGRFAADVLYFYGEDSNATAVLSQKTADVPAGYAFDLVNPDALEHLLRVSDHALTTASGMRYRLLVLDAYSKNMSLPVLRALHRLVEQGAVVVGPMPVADPSLADSQEEFVRLRVELFGKGRGKQHVGAGTVYAGATAQEALKEMGVVPDFEHSQPKEPILFVHRSLPDAEVYWVDNRSDQGKQVDAVFRVAGKVPELWRAEDGEARPLSYRMAGGRTTVPLSLEPWGTAFVVFRKATTEAEHVVPQPQQKASVAVTGPWAVAFEAGRGAPATAQFEHLISWPESKDAEIKYFSGKATYSTRVQVEPQWLGGKGRVWLDLGEVANLAEVTVNGKPLGQVWHKPFRVDVTSALKAGENVVQVSVTNAWVNRLIGDQQAGARAYTFSALKPYQANSPLQASGLLGPVKLVEESLP